MKILILFLMLLMSNGCSNFIHKTCSNLLSEKIYGDFLSDTNECKEKGFCISDLGGDL